MAWTKWLKQEPQTEGTSSKKAGKRSLDLLITICNQQVGGSSPSTSSIVGANCARSVSAVTVRAAKTAYRFVAPPPHAATASLGRAVDTGDQDAQVNMGVFPSGQRGQTVNLLAMPTVVRIHPPPPKQP